MSGLNGLNGRARRLEHAIPSPVDSEDVRDILRWVTNDDLAAMEASPDDVHLADEAMETARRRRAGGFPPFSGVWWWRKQHGNHQ